MKITSFYRISINPGFAFPVFEHEGMAYCQEGKGDKVTGFSPVNIEGSIIIKAKPEQEFSVSIGDELIYAFQLTNREIVFGTKEQIIPFIRSEIPKFKRMPFMRSEMAEFIGDEKEAEIANMECDKILEDCRKKSEKTS